MLRISNDVKCVVCKSLFCCLECRQRHEQNAHSEQEVLAERERMNCGFCNGHRAVEFDKRNDFAFILHICQFHLPLHCKKCFTQFNSIDDFSALNKCAHLNGSCSLQALKQETNNNFTRNATSNTNTNLITVIPEQVGSNEDLSQKTSAERCNSDSILSLRNCSADIHSSTQLLYRTQSPQSVEKLLVRQTSTPMDPFMRSPDTANCYDAAASGISNQFSSIYSSSDSEFNSFCSDKCGSGQHNLPKNVLVTQKKTMPLKKAKQSLTPLKRHVMAKSIHRAILQYQHSHGGAQSPISPLDLRVRSALSRGLKCPRANCSPNTGCDKCSPASNAKRIHAITVKPHSLDTVFEQVKHIDGIPGASTGVSRADGSRNNSLEATPLNTHKKPPNDLDLNRTHNDNDDIWHTPNEFPKIPAIDNTETPKTCRHRSASYRINWNIEQENIEDDDLVANDNCQHPPSMQSTEPSGNIIWTFVSSVFRFTKLSLANKDQVKGKAPTHRRDKDATGSMTSFSRCSTFTDVLVENNSQSLSCDELNEMDTVQPIKRRRIALLNGEHFYKYKKRIQCRPPIRKAHQITQV